VAPLPEPSLPHQGETVTMTETGCVICGRPTDDRYCCLHAGVYARLIPGYAAWTRALDVDGQTCLQRVAAQLSTGRWRVDVCRDLLAHQGKALKA